MSAAEVRDSYSESLSKLTFNSRPVIMNLTELANEYRHEYALVIVQCIEERMKRVSYPYWILYGIRN